MRLLRFAMLLLGEGLALLLAVPAEAQLGGTDNGTPINVQADNGIEWQQNQQLYIARGHAVAVRGPASIKADTIIAHYRKPTGQATANTENNSEIYRIEAEGNVVITRDSRTVVGDRADYDMDQGIGIVTGKALKMTTATDVITAKDALEWYDQKQISVARGDAVAVRQGGRTIKGDILTAYMVKSPAQQPAAAPGQPPKPNPPPVKTAAATAPGANGTPAAPANGDDSKINRVDAQGHVVVVNGPDIGRGDYGVYNAVTDICTLLGNVTITRGTDVVTGQYAVMDMKTNISRIMPASSLPGSTRQRVQGLFVKQDVPGADKTAPGNTPGNKTTPGNKASPTGTTAPATAAPANAAAAAGGK